MAGIYIHVPFCRKACHYCDFHFSTSFSTYEIVAKAILKEIRMRKDYLDEEIKTIYFGGGTPSLLQEAELNSIMETIFAEFPVCSNAEITLEANPDDLDKEKLRSLRSSGINRLSIGVQSFRDKDLLLMNRSHSAATAIASVRDAREEGFENITIDLIYGIPGLTDADWLENLETAGNLKVPHLSCYSLTVEERTALSHFIKKGKIKPLDEGAATKQFFFMTEFLEQAGYFHYEISNFCLPGQESKHNSSYWKGSPYLGIGPSAHSFNGDERSWNISNNHLYSKSIQENILPLEKEILSPDDKFNEYLMTRLRTAWGADKGEISLMGNKYLLHLEQKAIPFIRQQLMTEKENKLFLTKQGMIVSDHISSSLFC